MSQFFIHDHNQISASHPILFSLHSESHINVTVFFPFRITIRLRPHILFSSVFIRNPNQASLKTDLLFQDHNKTLASHPSLFNLHSKPTSSSSPNPVLPSSGPPHLDCPRFPSKPTSASRPNPVLLSGCPLHSDRPNHLRLSSLRLYNHPSLYSLFLVPYTFPSFPFRRLLM